MTNDEPDELKQALRASCFRSFFYGKRVDLPLYFHHLKRSPRSADEGTAYDTLRIERSHPHRTDCHILIETPKAVV